ncbi:MAG: LysR family transcriptional regulator, partial [Myxococcota bacterium]
HLSQPAVSRRIRQLEEDFNAELVERSGRGIVLTETGRLVVAEARVLIDRFENLKEDVRRRERLDAGIVRIGGGATAVSYVLPDAIGDFRRDHPRVLFEVREAGSREIEEAVRQESLELGLVTVGAEVDHDGDFTVQPLLTDRIVLVAGAGHPLAQKRRMGAAELDGLSLVGFEAGTAIRRLIDDALRQAGVKMSVVMELRSIAGILKMVETTRSLAFISSLGAPPDRSIQVRGLKVERRLAVIAKKRRPLSKAAAAFADALLRGRRRAASVRKPDS